MNSHPEKQQKKVLCVGLACVDIINLVPYYPSEDEDLRCKEQIWSRGGNASNTAAILSQLGTQVEYLGTLAKQPSTSIITEDLQRWKVNHENCPNLEDCATPMSCVILSEKNGSRTILNANKSLPELTFEDFDKLALDCYYWIHFEGRNIEEVKKMISKLESWNSSLNDKQHQICISVEVEKMRVDEDLMKRADVVFVSKEYAYHRGFQNAEEALKGFSHLLKPGAKLTCAWGEAGAWGRDSSSNIIHSPCYPPPRVVDTLAAGDTFNAGIIHSLHRGASLEEAIIFSCRLAGYKCGVSGLNISKFVLEER